MKENEELPFFLSPDAQTRDMVVEQRRQTLLPKDYSLTSYDILCGRSKVVFGH
jgi:hypothetical protein